MINVIHDVTAERQARARAQARSTRREPSSPRRSTSTRPSTRSPTLLVPRFADYCIVDMVDDGRLRQVVIAHRNPEREQLLRELRERYPPNANAAHPVSEVLATGEPYLVEDARVEALSHAAVDEEHLALYRRLEAMSYIVVPLEARGRMLGTISLGTGESGRRFGELDLSLARELARRAALAIDNALLFGAAQQSYAQLNTLLVSAPVGIGFWDRDLRFVRVNDALATINGLSPEEHVGRYLGEVVGELAPILVPLYRRVLETGEPVVHTESTDDAALQMGERRHWLSSYYPVHTPEGEVIGIGAVIMEITDRKRADDRLRLLAEAGELFSTSLDQDEIASRIAHVGVPRLADTCNVYLLRDGVLARVACVAADPAAQPVLESLPQTFALADEPGQIANVFKNSEPLLLRTLPDDYLNELERFGAERVAIERIGTRSLMLVPIVARGRDPRHSHARVAAPRSFRRARPRPRAGARRPRRRRDGQRGARRRAAARRPDSAGARVRRRRRLPRRPRGRHPALESGRRTDHRALRGRGRRRARRDRAGRLAARARANGRRRSRSMGRTASCGSR